VDSGDFIGRQGESAQLEAEFTLKAMQLINYDAIALGEKDFLQRVDFLLSQQQKQKIPFVSANIFQADGKKLAFPPYVIKEAVGLKKGSENLHVGIFGLLFKRLQIVLDKNEPQLVVGDPIKAAQNIVNEIKDKCDVIIALAHVRYPEIKALADSVPGINVIIGSHDPIFRSAPEMMGNVITMVGGNKGQYIGDLKLEFDRDKKIINHSGKIVLLGNDINDDPQIDKLIREYKVEKVSSTKRQLGN